MRPFVSCTSPLSKMSASPIFVALPAGRAFSEYDSDGDVIMATTPPRRPIALAPPPAPIRMPRMDAEPREDLHPRNLVDDMDEAMPPFLFARGNAPPPFLPPPEVEAPPGGEPEEEAGWGIQDPLPESWCVSAVVPDLTLRLDFRHPRVLLHFLRFVSSYNEIAPEGEEIHLPAIPREVAQEIYQHSAVNEVPEEFQIEAKELRNLVRRHTCWCERCESP